MLINQNFTQDRTKYLGGSDIGALLGLSAYRTPLELWLEKTGQVVPQTDSLPLRFGSFAEAFVAAEYTRSTGFKLVHDESIYIHPQHTFMSAHIDRFVLGDGANRPATHLVECKTANPFTKGQWGGSRIGSSADELLMPMHLVYGSHPIRASGHSSPVWQ